MDVKKYVFNFVIVFGLLATTSWADSYTGSIKYSDGLIGTAVWSSAELSWTVDNETNPGLWTYAYTFTVDAKDISYVINGVWENFTSESIKNGTTASCELGSFGHQGKSAPGIPEDIYGMKCTPSDDSLTYSWSIVTNRGPMWDDFYAKSGKHKGHWVYAYNTGFGTDPPDSTIADGNNGGWVLVPGMTYHEKVVQDFAINRFERIRNAIDGEDDSTPTAEFIHNRIEVKSEKWVYVLDRVGQQIFRPIATYPHLKYLYVPERAIPSLEEWIKLDVPESTISEARRLAMTTIGMNYMGDVDIIPARELVTSKNIRSGITRHYEGRTMIMFSSLISNDLKVTKHIAEPNYYEDGERFINTHFVSDQSPRSYETAISFAGEKVVRVESRVPPPPEPPENLRIVEIFHEGLLNGYIKGRPQIHLFLNFGSFFSPSEWQFEYNAYAWEGEDFTHFLAHTCNPWLPWFPEYIPFCGDDPWLDFDYVRTWIDYQEMFMGEWCDLGGYNGIRGNCFDYDVATHSCRSSESWEFPSHRVVMHKDLGTYNLDCGPNICELPFTVFPHCEGSSLLYLTGVGQKLEKQFYDDLEKCHVAMISTHGGVPGCDEGLDFYQFKKQIDVWVSLKKAGHKFGQDNLRHLFLQTCDSMGSVHGPLHGGPRFFDSQWFNVHVADGIRTVCGLDGPATGIKAHVTGLPFFSRYHNGDSIIDSFFGQELDACPCNTPVTIAYAATEDEAFRTLYDGRFNKARTVTGHVVAAGVITPHISHHAACCLPYDPEINGRPCENLPTFECIAQGGIPAAIGTYCKGGCISGGIDCNTEACCMEGGFCSDLPKNDCMLGIPQGVGTNCDYILCP